MHTRSFLTLCVALAATLFYPHATRAQDDAVTKMAKEESLGDLKIELAEKELIKLLGKPESVGKVTREEGDGAFVQVLKYPSKGLEVTVSAEKKTGPRTVSKFSAGAGCKLATKKGITVGSSVSDVQKAYTGFVRNDSSDEQIVVGSIYNAVFFDIAGGKVSRISF